MRLKEGHIHDHPPNSQIPVRLSLPYQRYWLSLPDCHSFLPPALEEQLGTAARVFTVFSQLLTEWIGIETRLPS